MHEGGVTVQTELFTSPELAASLSGANTEDFGVFRVLWLSFKRRWLLSLILFSTVTVAASWRTLQQKPVFQANGELRLKIEASTALSGTLRLNPFESLGGSPIATEIQVMRSAPVVEDTIRALNLRTPDGALWSRDVFLSGLSVRPIPNTDVLVVSYTDSDPEKAARVVNQLMESYITNTIQSNRSQAAAARKFILEQLPKTLSSLEKAETELREFREKNEVIALEQEAKTTLGLMGELEGQLAQTRSQIASTTAELETLQQQVGFSPEQAIALSRVAQSAAVQNTLGNLQKLAAQLATQRTLYTGEHHAIVRLEWQRKALQALLQEQIQAEVGNRALPGDRLSLGELELELMGELVKTQNRLVALQTLARSLQEAAQSYRSRLNFIPELEQQQRILERRLAVSQTTYEGLLKRLQEVEIAENQTIGSATVLSQASVPKFPISPRILLGILQGGALGVALAIATLLVLQGADTTIRTTDRAREAYGYLLLAILPGISRKFGESPATFVRDRPQSPIGEAYRMLQGSLNFLRSDKPLQAIAITSAVAGEGKSTVASNLATVMAQLGRKVLLVDADMRRPTQAKGWGVKGSPGLSNLLVGDAVWEDCVQGVMDNLTLLPSGTLPPDPVAILDSHRMAALLEQWQLIYDCVILDTPPVLAVLDGVLLGRLADGMVVVARPGTVNLRNAQRVKAVLAQARITVLGMVINDAAREDSSDYMYDYYYQYGATAAAAEVEEESATVPTNVS
ncbi:MAG: GumC family protein [Pseudanabaenaceae cyanobacterium]